MKLQKGSTVENNIKACGYLFEADCLDFSTLVVCGWYLGSREFHLPSGISVGQPPLRRCRRTSPSPTATGRSTRRFGAGYSNMRSAVCGARALSGRTRSNFVKITYLENRTWTWTKKFWLLGDCQNVRNLPLKYSGNVFTQGIIPPHNNPFFPTFNLNGRNSDRS